MPEVQRVYDANLRVYGADKVWRQLLREGVAVARCTVERLMRRLGLQGVRRGKGVRTTVPDAKAACPLDRVNRQFKGPAAKPAVGGRLSPTSRPGKASCTSPSSSMSSRGASSAGGEQFDADRLRARCAGAGAVARRAERDGDLVHHSDRGSQYVSIRYSERLAEAGIEPSVGSTGDSYDNALAETINGCTRPRSSIDAGRGRRGRQSNLPRWSGSRGSTTIACWNPSATSRRPKPRQTTGASKLRYPPQRSPPGQRRCRRVEP